MEETGKVETQVPQQKPRERQTRYIMVNPLVMDKWHLVRGIVTSKYPLIRGSNQIMNVVLEEYLKAQKEVISNAIGNTNNSEYR